MLRAWLWIAVCLALGCGRPSTGDEPARRSGEQRGPRSRCQITPGHDCLAEGLPRVGKDWPAAKLRAFLARAQLGVVAFDLNDDQTEIVPCLMPGHYVEVLGEPKAARFWASHHVLYHYTDIPPDCAEATHVAAAFVTLNGRQLSAILVPLPCPSIWDEQSAPGCVGRGLTGPQRKERAEVLTRKIERPGYLPNEREYAPQLLEIYALAPDVPGARILGAIADLKSSTDCFYRSEAGWIAKIVPPVTQEDHLPPETRKRRAQEWLQRELPAWSRLRRGIDFSDDCETRPAFLSCFPGQFAPAMAVNCWQPVDTRDVGSR